VSDAAEAKPGDRRQIAIPAPPKGIDRVLVGIRVNKLLRGEPVDEVIVGLTRREVSYLMEIWDILKKGGFFKPTIVRP
jgi:hypothetical protein